MWNILWQIIKDNESELRVLSLVIGPIATIVALLLSLRDRRILAKQNRELGVAEQKIKEASTALAAKDSALRASEANNAERTASIDALQTNLRQLTAGSNELWRIRPPRAFDKYKEWIHDPKGARIITVGNLKGGVAKTTLAANLAAYISEIKSLPVLLIDLDFQGSLSNMVLAAAGKEETGSPVNSLFDPAASLATLVSNEIHLAPRVSRGWIVPASYPLAQLESNLLLQWIMEGPAEIDVRYRLAHLLLNPDVRRKYAAIIFDMPPRLALGAVNALVASHYVLVPTMLDKLSSEAVGQFLTTIKAMKKEMSLSLDLAGIAGMMTRLAARTPRSPSTLSGYCCGTSRR